LNLETSSLLNTLEEHLIHQASFRAFPFMKPAFEPQ